MNQVLQKKPLKKDSELEAKERELQSEMVKKVEELEAKDKELQAKDKELEALQVRLRKNNGCGNFFVCLCVFVLGMMFAIVCVMSGWHDGL
jgi:hypothetical protein